MAEIRKGLRDLIAHSPELQHAAVDVRTREERDKRLKRAEEEGAAVSRD